MVDFFAAGTDDDDDYQDEMILRMGSETILGFLVITLVSLAKWDGGFDITSQRASRRVSVAAAFGDST